jgi:glycosyltransferase involved in cell wall biosynthesis
MLLSLVVPMYNEKEVIAYTYQRLSAVLSEMDMDYEMIFVNDGSRDGTVDVLLEAAAGDGHVKIIDFAKNFGHQMAVRAGLSKASGDAVVIIDADLQDPPEVIPGMLERWREGYDVVYGKRISREGESVFKKFTAFAFYRVLNMLAGIEIPADTGDFRLIGRNVKDAILSMNEHGTFLRGMVSWVGFKQVPYEFERQKRFAGTTKYPLKKMLKLAFDGIYSFSTKPIRFILSGGVLSLLAGLVLLIVCMITKLSEGSYIVAAILLATGVLMVSMYVLGEYIGRIYEEVMNRPLYIISRTIGFGEDE